MGICLDTDANTATQEQAEPGTDWKGGGGDRAGRRGTIETPVSARSISMHNPGKVKFDPPKVPVIFVLGGPGSGKVTHCDTLMQEKKGIAHINMMDLLQQYAIGNDINIPEMQDFSQISSKTVTEVLMLEIKMAPAAKAYLISGYPRSMRDVVEYTEKIQVINGVILISWRQAVLQKQIDYGAKLGHVVLSLAKMELDNFFKNVIPVADYFDQSDMLMAVNGERAPSEVYKDFRLSVLDILSALDNQEALLNGVAGMGKGMNEIPGSIVSVETAPSKEQNSVTAIVGGGGGGVGNNNGDGPLQILNPNTLMGQNTSLNQNGIIHSPPPPPQPVAQLKQPPAASLVPIHQQQQHHHQAPKIDLKKLPPIICIIGGPGSNKATLCLKAISTMPGWGHFSVGRLVRSIAESDPKANTENHMIKESITTGEMVGAKSIDKLIETNLRQLVDKKGILMDGYPRDIEQVRDFEKKYNQKPPIVLLDCSKLQLGRGRIDDTVSSFRRRLELFRELTLPMLKIMDTEGRLTIVDGDTDSPSVQKDFEKVLRKNSEKLFEERKLGGGVDGGDGGSELNTNIEKLYNYRNNQSAVDLVHDLEQTSPPGVVPTITHPMTMLNGGVGGVGVGGGGRNIQNGHVMMTNGKKSFRNMLDDSEYPVDSYM